MSKLGIIVWLLFASFGGVGGLKSGLSLFIMAGKCRFYSLIKTIKMTWTDKQLNDAEEGVTKLTEATNLSDKEIVDVIADGFAMKYKGKLPDNIYDLIDELRATFDAY